MFSNNPKHFKKYRSTHSHHFKAYHKKRNGKKNKERQYYAETLTFYGFWLFLYLRNIFYCLESAHSFKTNFFSVAMHLSYRIDQGNTRAGIPQASKNNSFY